MRVLSAMTSSRSNHDIFTYHYFLKNYHHWYKLLKSSHIFGQCSHLDPKPTIPDPGKSSRQSELWNMDLTQASVS